jgi:transcriptional regulator with XRE-family HTH domain
MNYGKAIRKYLQIHGISATSFSKICGVPQPVLSRLLSGQQHGVHSRTLEKLWPYLSENKKFPPEDNDEGES